MGPKHRKQLGGGRPAGHRCADPTARPRRPCRERLEQHARVQRRARSGRRRRRIRGRLSRDRHHQPRQRPRRRLRARDPHRGNHRGGRQQQPRGHRDELARHHPSVQVARPHGQWDQRQPPRVPSVHVRLEGPRPEHRHDQQLLRRMQRSLRFFAVSV